MSELDYQPDHEARAAGYLILAHRLRPRLLALVQSIAAGVQMLEDLLFEISIEGSFRSAKDDALDRWGAIIGQAREGLDNATYRKFIGGRAIVNRSRRNVDDTARAFQAIMAPYYTVEVHELAPASYVCWAWRETLLDDVTASAAARLMADANPMGVGSLLIESPRGYFGWDGDADALGFDVGDWSRVL